VGQNVILQDPIIILSVGWLINFSDPIGCHGRTASNLTAPAQIPACGTTALGSSEILASVKDKLVLPSLLFPAGRFAFVPPVLLVRQMLSFAGYVFCQPLPLFVMVTHFNATVWVVG